MWDDELVAVNFLGLGKIAAIPAACNQMASFLYQCSAAA
jgi:hypothetical protein